MARNINKEAQSRSFFNKYRPLRDIGKWRLSATSESYKKAMEALRRADDLMRDAAHKQKVYLKDMKSYKKSFYGNRFAQVASAFMREQEVINRTVGKLENVYAEIAEEAGFDRGESITTVIDHEVKGKPPVRTEQNVEDDVDIDSEWDNDDRPGMLGRMFQYSLGPSVRRIPGVKKEYGQFGDSGKATRLKEVASLYNDELQKEAFIGNWYWGQTASGKKLKMNFDTVYNALQGVFNKNITVLKSLDELRSIGDPGKYLEACKKPNVGFQSIKELKANAKFAEAWEQFRKSLVKQDENKPKETDGQQPTKQQEPQEDQSMKAAPAPKEVAQPVVSRKPNRADVVRVQPRNPKSVTPPPPPADKSNDKPATPDEAIEDNTDKKNDVEKQVAGYYDFANQIMKQAEMGDLDGVISNIAKYADLLDEAGFEDEALKLTAVLEGFIDE